MTLSRNRLVLTTFAAAAAALVLCDGAFAPGGGILTAPAFAQQVKPEELAAEWDKGWDRANSESAKKYESLYKWCKEKRIDFTAINVRRLVLRYDPENEEVRKFVGYGREGDKWIRNENRRDQIRQESDVEDPKAQKYPEKQASFDKSVIGIWKALANKAKKNGTDDAANAAAWTEKAARAWERVLQVNSSNEEAHKALGHPKFAGKLVRPEALPFLKTRAERKDGGQKRAQAPHKTAPIDLSPLLKDAGLTGAGAKSEHFTVSTVHGKDVAARVATWGERTLADFVEIYQYPADLVERLPWNSYNYCKDREEFKQVLLKSGRSPADVDALLKYAAGTQVKGEPVAHASPGADSDDHIIHYTCHAISEAVRRMAIQDVGSPNEGLEDWLRESMAYDMTRRMTGTTLWMCVSMGKYGMDIEPHPEKDIWIELAKRQVEYDDDVPLSRLWKLKIENQEIKGPEIVKGYAVVQFVFESDPEKGRKFIWTAAAQGTPKAVEAVYGCTMDELDAKYRDWILKSW